MSQRSAIAMPITHSLPMTEAGNLLSTERLVKQDTGAEAQHFCGSLLDMIPQAKHHGLQKEAIRLQSWQEGRGVDLRGGRRQG